MPDLLTDVDAMRARTRAWRGAGARIALVPTMGDLHAGHLALVERARAAADRVVVSIFVNPMQFGPAEDYAAYPRALERDGERLDALGVDCIFAPAIASLYPYGLDAAVRVTVPALDGILCGVDRPGHFTGVATVVAKLFTIVAPDRAVFGEKDYQQLLLIRRLAAELGFAIAIEGVPTLREADGLALSSRNGYLDAGQRAQAPQLHATLLALAQRIAAGERDFAHLVGQAEQRLRSAGFHPDYVEVRRSHDLAPAAPEDAPDTLRVLAAAHLGLARLIDNLPVVAR